MHFAHELTTLPNLRQFVAEGIELDDQALDSLTELLAKSEVKVFLTRQSRSKTLSERFGNQVIIESVNSDAVPE